MLTLEALRTFAALVEEGSFTAAADRLHATQSGVSQRIARLERVLGVTLFERGPRGATATPAGRRLYARCNALLREVSAIESELGALGRGIGGSVRVGLMPALTRFALGPALRACLQANPNATVHVIESSSAELIAEVGAGRLDAALVPAFDPPPSMRCRALERTPEALLARAQEPSLHMRPVDLARLAPIRLVLQSGAHIRRRRILAHLRARAVEVEALLELDSMFGTLEQVRHSDYVTILPAVMLAPEIESAELCVRPVADQGLALEPMLIEPARREPSALVADLVGRIEQGVAAFNASLRAAPSAPARPRPEAGG